MSGDGCQTCGFVAKSAAGLTSHIRHKHPAPVPPSSNVDAAQALIGELRRCGRLEQIDVADEMALLAMASQLDADPSNAAMWRQYREHIQTMRFDDGGSDDVDAVVAALRGTTTMGDQTPF